ncbi:cupin domain-containing protein [Pseudonocardia alni]|uniref:cupin domain-containing protein n=1 Tax=Pseudonocardia alni TaxID=33907 RepID=UPI0033E7BACF
MTENGTTREVEFWARTDLQDEMPGQRGRWLIGPGEGRWDEVLLSEWELTNVGWSDLHPHWELNYVLEGELHVECGGDTVVARAGDAVRVPAGVNGRYSAPEYARMLVILGPNPGGEDSDLHGQFEV